MKKEVSILIKKEDDVIITQRWCRIVQALADCNSVGDAAIKLGWNKRTLESVIAEIKFKLNCNTQAQLVALFFRKKLIK